MKISLISVISYGLLIKDKSTETQKSSVPTVNPTSINFKTWLETYLVSVSEWVSKKESSMLQMQVTLGGATN